MRGPALQDASVAVRRRYLRPIADHAPLVLPPGAGETVRPGFEIKVGRPELVLTEAIYAPGDTGPDPHVHHDHVDSFFVVEGQLEWRVGPDLEPHTGAAGSFASVPRDVLHTFRNPGPGHAAFLFLLTPALGGERFFREFADTLRWQEGPPDPAALNALAAPFGLEFVGPPLGPGG